MTEQIPGRYGADARSDFWGDVDSQSIARWTSEWQSLRDGQCIALMSDNNRCHRPASFGWCAFHFDRVVETVAMHHEEQVLAKIRRRNPEAFRFVVDAARLEDAERVLEAADAQVYFIACDGFVKIGYSKNPVLRLSQLQHQRRATSRTLAPEGIDLAEAVIVGCISGEQQVERRIHSLLSEYREVGEWFRLTPTVITAIDCLVFGAKAPRAIEAGLRDLMLHGGGSRRSAGRIAS